MSVTHAQAQNQVRCQIGEASLPNGKRLYLSPALVCYGSVSVLTRAGGTGSNEGSAAGSMNMSTSDIRLKQNIARVGDHPLGFGIYLFDYKPEFRGQLGDVRQFGVMAQEVEAVIPAAVLTYPDGYKRVNYAMLGIDLSGRRVH